MVHEYGGGAYCIHDGTVFFSNFDDQRLYRQEEGADPLAITREVNERSLRYADGRVTGDGALWIGIRERHPAIGRPAEVVNELVVLPTDGSAEPTVIASGRDFYSNPRISSDGRAFVLSRVGSPVDAMGRLRAVHGRPRIRRDRQTNVEQVAGRDGEESIWQPEWSPAGDLVFASDRSGWWNIERIRRGERERLYEAEAEFGGAAWVFGLSTYAFLGDGRMVCVYERDGRASFGVLSPEQGTLDPLELPHDAWSGYLAAEGSAAVFVAGSATVPNQVVRIDVSSGETEILRESVHVPVDTSYFSIPRAIEFPTEGGLTANALFYPPTNPGFDAPEEERPPVIVWSHGGPTDHATSLFSLRTQFWTSRGFGIVDVNYGGSTGHGRAYRERLNGQWGVVDLDDCVNAGRYLVAEGKADPDRLLIRGGSAGGYTTICALTFTDEFAAGASYYGIADLEPKEGHTHKFEMRYEHTLLGPYPEKAEIFRARSPINFTDRLSTPMLVLQGTDDEIVPPYQAELIVAALDERGIPHAYLLFEGEGHGFRRAENIARSLEAELSFYLQVLGLEPGDPLPRLEIQHLPA